MLKFQIHSFSCPVWGHSSVVISFSFAEPRWRVATGGMDKAVLLWNMHSGALEHRLLGHSGGVGFARLSVMKRTGARQSDLGATIQLFSVQECGVLS
jgi:WD40 repeat protein